MTASNQIFKNRSLIIIAIGFLLFQLFLNLKTIINIPLELFFQPWMVAKGLLPYVDFFDHHGFLPYYLLAPLTFGKDLFGLKLFFIFLQALNLLILQFALRKSSRTQFLFANIFYVCINFLAIQNNLLMDSMIQTFLLSAYILLTSIKTETALLISGTLIGLASTIKFPALLPIVPLALIYRKKSAYLLSGLAAIWILSFAFLEWNGMSKDFIIDNFSFNSFLSNKLNLFPYTGFFDYEFRIFFLALVPLFFLLLKNYAKIKKLIRENSLLLAFTVGSLYALPSGVVLSHIPTTITFLTILLAILFKEQSKKWNRNYFFGAILFSLILIGYSLRHGQIINYTTTEYVRDPKVLELENYLKINNLGGKEFFVYGDYVELYEFFDQLPPTKFPIKYPMMKNVQIQSYFKNFEGEEISGIVKNKVETIIVPIPLQDHWKNLNNLESFVKNNYHQTYIPQNFSVLQKN